GGRVRVYRGGQGPARDVVRQPALVAERPEESALPQVWYDPRGDPTADVNAGEGEHTESEVAGGCPEPVHEQVQGLLAQRVGPCQRVPEDDGGRIVPLHFLAERRVLQDVTGAREIPVRRHDPR